MYICHLISKRRHAMTEASNLQAIPTEAWDSSLDHIVGDMNGNPLNIHKLLANHPDLLNAWWSLRKYLVAGGSLGKRNAELVILRTAVHACNWYEWASHVVRGLHSELTLIEIERVMDGPAHPDWADPDALLLLAVDELSTRAALDTEIVEGLEAHFGRSGVLDLIALRSMYVMLGDMLNTWNVELDEQVSDALPDTVTRDRFESRR
jgi:alkylhydroperoxidase family enzyme